MVPPSDDNAFRFDDWQGMAPARFYALAAAAVQRFFADLNDCSSAECWT
jgi:hypothetical protein